MEAFSMSSERHFLVNCEEKQMETIIAIFGSGSEGED